MTPLRLPPMWADELPEVLCGWLLAPLAEWLVTRDPKLDEVRLIGVTENGFRLVLRPAEARSGWDKRARAAFAAVLDAAPDALDADPVLLEQLAPQLPPGETLLATATRDRRYARGEGWFVKRAWVGPALEKAPKPALEVDPEVADLVAGLQAMDDADTLALRLLEVLTQLDAGDQGAAQQTLRGILDA